MRCPALKIIETPPDSPLGARLAGLHFHPPDFDRAVRFRKNDSLFVEMKYAF